MCRTGGKVRPEWKRSRKYSPDCRRSGNCRGRRLIERKDIEWVIEFGHYSPRIDKKVTKGEQVGCINGLAVFGNSTGTVIEIEACATRTVSGEGTIKISGIVEEEEMDGRGHRLRRTSSARASVDNVLTVLKRFWVLIMRIMTFI